MNYCFLFSFPGLKTDFPMQGLGLFWLPPGLFWAAHLTGPVPVLGLPSAGCGPVVGLFWAQPGVGYGPVLGLLWVCFRVYSRFADYLRFRPSSGSWVVPPGGISLYSHLFLLCFYSGKGVEKVAGPLLQ